jgi:nickel/cobalt transporter (NicO) family protein
MKPAHLSRTTHQAVLAVLLITCTLALDVHSASAQIVAFGSPHGIVVGGIAGWVLAKQALFYRALAGIIRSAKTDGFAVWSLMGISFVYGIFHAAGPGHGKAVISSYLVANEETWRRGMTLSFAAAAMQSLTAVIIVSVAAVLLGATAKLGRHCTDHRDRQLWSHYAAWRSALMGKGAQPYWCTACAKSRAREYRSGNAR